MKCCDTLLLQSLLIQQSIDALWTMWCKPFSKPFPHIFHSYETQNFAYANLLNLFTCFLCDPRKLMWRHFVTFSMCSIGLSMAIILIGNDLVSRSRNMYVVCWSTWRNFRRNYCWLPKKFTRLTNVSTSTP